MKYYYEQAVSEAIRAGAEGFDRINLFCALNQIRIQTSKSSTIKSAWKHAGIVPFNHDVILRQIPRLEDPPDDQQSHNDPYTPEE
jgi:hypothetical protein